MELLAAFAVFLVGTFACMALGWSLSWGLALGLVCFTLVGLRRGLSLRALVRMAGEGARTSLVVLRILVLIGFLTALWRASGTIAFFVHTGLEWMHPSAFYLAAFLLASALSMAFGSSFGVAGTAGVILAAIARSGGASLAVTGGAVLSGAYLGERLSPASSSAALTAALAGVEQTGHRQKAVYRITEAGRNHLHTLIADALRASSALYPTTLYSALSLADKLPPAEVRLALEEQRRRLEAEYAALERGRAGNEGQEVPPLARITIDNMVDIVQRQRRCVEELLAAVGEAP